MSTNIFPKQAKKEQAETKQQNKLFVNVGIPVEIDGQQVFIDLPLSITADNIDKAIETVQKRINEKTPSNIVEVMEGKVVIAEAVQSLFNAMEEGQEVLSTDIDNNNEHFGCLNQLQVRFYKAKDKSVDTTDSKQSIRNKLFK